MVWYERRSIMGMTQWVLTPGDTNPSNATLSDFFLIHTILFSLVFWGTSQYMCMCLVYLRMWLFVCALKHMHVQVFAQCNWRAVILSMLYSILQQLDLTGQLCWPPQPPDYSTFVAYYHVLLTVYSTLFQMSWSWLTLDCSPAPRHKEVYGFRHNWLWDYKCNILGVFYVFICVLMCESRCCSTLFIEM